MAMVASSISCVHLQNTYRPPTPALKKHLRRPQALPPMPPQSLAPTQGLLETFSSIKAKGKVAFIPYLTAGDPDLQTTIKALKVLESCGSDIIELGMPFSDPLLDGPVIQAAARRALAKGTNFDAIVSMLREVIPQLSCPIVLFSYYNPILKHGVGKFMSTIRNVGVHGLLVPDIPLEETKILRSEALKHKIELVLITTAITPTDRMKAIVQASGGFVYLATNKPVAVGFGISTPEHVNQLSVWGADGVIIGSALVKILGEAKSPEEGLKELETFTKSLKAAIQ